MNTLSEVVDAISERGLRLFRTAEGVRAEGDCPPELAEGIRRYQKSLLPILPPAAELQATEDADSIRQQITDFALAIAQRYLPKLMDERLSHVVDTQSPAEVRREIFRLTKQTDAIDWAGVLFPLTMETEAKHAVESGAVDGEMTAGEVPI